MKSIASRLAATALGIMVLVSCSNYAPLYEKTDYYMENLSSSCSSFGLSMVSDGSQTSDGRFLVTPIGRMIVVKNLKPMTDQEMSNVEKALQNKYKDNVMVNKVFVNEKGTITIDCRR